MVTVLSMRKEINVLSKSMAEVDHSPTKKNQTRSAITSWKNQDNRGLKVMMHNSLFPILLQL
jgi:hypothetical protein